MCNLTFRFVILTTFVWTASVMARQENMAKTDSVLYPSSMTARAAANAAAIPWAATVRNGLVAAAEPWISLPDDFLWNAVFGPNIKRSWMVWSDGFCPACKKDVKMYTWEIDVWSAPWKMRCPHCKEYFPKNDFEAFHKSGLDEHGIFVPQRADRNLLFNVDHPDPNDPLHKFGVDDGDGYVDGEGHRWRFIGAYLIYGQWKKVIVGGVVNLSNAYLVTGDPKFARKAFIMLDRVADVFPSYDFTTQGLVYEGRSGGPTRGQVSTWHDACEEMRQLVESYDKIFEAGLKLESELVPYLSQKAQTYKNDPPRNSWADIQRHIEQGIFLETLNHRDRIESNYPTTDRTILFIETILGWLGNRDEILAMLDGVLDKATAVDGLSGEKGLAGYSTIAPRTAAEMLGKLSRIDPGFLKTVFDRHRRLHDMYRFHIDTWCMCEYYPASGDTSAFAHRSPHYAAVSFSRNPGVDPSMYTFFWNLYELTGDPVFVQLLYRENEGTTDGLPFDLFAAEPAGFQAQVKAVIDQVGPEIKVGSVNKQQWRLAVLRSGEGARQRALWLDYDAGERHSHADAMNLGYFAKGLDLMPDFGYPPVGYGGWLSPKAQWYTKTAAHNTVVVDGADQNRVNSGTTTLWADGNTFHAVTVSDPALYGIERYERFAALVDVDADDSYLLDCFRVAGGKDHAKFFHGHFGTIETGGLTVQDAEPFGKGTEMRNFRRDANPQPGWYVDWNIEDKLDYLPGDRNVRMRYTDLTGNAEAYLAEAWIDPSLYGVSGGMYIPCVVTRRLGEVPLTTTFLAVIDSYEVQPNVPAVRRLPVRDPAGTDLGEQGAALELTRRDGRKDICVLPPPGAAESVEPVNGIHLYGAVGLATLGPAGAERIIVCSGARMDAGTVSAKLKQVVAFVELRLDNETFTVAAGDRDNVESVSRDGQALRMQE